MSTHETSIIHAPISTALPASTSLAPPVKLPRDLPIERVYRFTVEQYQQMGRAKIFGPADRVELIEGVVVTMSPIGIAHVHAVDTLNYLLMPMLVPFWYPRIQGCVSFEYNEPEPDIAILRGRPHDYSKRHPSPLDSGLIIEVADSSLDSDRRLKGPLYARAGVQEYWIINLVDECIEVYRLPPGEQNYGAATIVDRNESIDVVLEGKVCGQIKVSDLMTE